MMENYSYYTAWEHFKAKLRGLKKSITAWFNSVMGSVVMALPLMESAFPSLQEFLPDNIYKLLAMAVILGNLGLRFKTTRDLADK